MSARNVLDENSGFITVIKNENLTDGFLGGRKCSNRLRRLSEHNLPARGFCFQRWDEVIANHVGYSTRASPLPFTTSPMSQALCFCDLMNFSTASALSAATMATIPIPMLKT